MKNTVKPIRRHHLQKSWPGWLFVSPFLIGFALYFFWVLFDSLRYSFSSVKLGATCEVNFVGWSNYIYAFRGHPTFVRALIESIGGMLASIPVVLVFSLFVAVLLNQSLPGRAAFRAIFFIPVIVSVGLIEAADSGNTVLSSMSSLSAIETGSEAVAGGLFTLADVQQTLQSLNFSPHLIAYVAGAVNNIMTVVNQSGVQIIIFLVGLQSISPSIYESAVMEGATGWETFWKITFPMISPMILVNLFFSVVDSLTRNSNSIMGLIRGLGIAGGKTGEASAMSWIYFLVISLLLAIVALICRRLVFYQNRED